MSINRIECINPMTYRNINYKDIFIYLFLSLIFASCASRKDIIYLQDMFNNQKVGSSVIDSLRVDFTPPKFKVDDRVTINISSLNINAARPYNLYVSSFNMGGVTSAGQQQQQSYLVDSKGEVSFPELGKIKIVGLTAVELEHYLEGELKNELPDVKANVQLVNFRVSILGEVQKPGEYKIDRNKISLFQAIGLAGDLTIYGKRDNVLLMRESEGELKYYNIDLRNKEMLESPMYYLKQNDVIYISPNKPRINASASSQTASYIISATGLLVTLISLFTR